MDAIPAVVNVQAYIEVIKEKSIERQLLNTMSQISNDVLDSKLSFNELLSNAERKLIEIINKEKQ